MPSAVATKEETPVEVAANGVAEATPPVDAVDPSGVDPTITTIEKDGVIFFPRGTDQLPPETKEMRILTPPGGTTKAWTCLVNIELATVPFQPGLRPVVVKWFC